MCRNLLIFPECREHAWGGDLLLPLSKDSEEWVNLGLTLVDSLDTLLLMGMEKEFLEARDWVAHDMVLQQVRVGFVVGFWPNSN